MTSFFKVAAVIITLFGLIYSETTPKVQYQSQCCPSDGTACYPSPSFCSDRGHCRPNIADYLCDASGGSCQPSGGHARAPKYFQCGYQRCYGEFKCVTIVSSGKTQSLDEEGSSQQSIPSRIAKGQES
ncbi:uncharacterized protein MELLADRAFT_124302 [Melampsora larici-populina 98AG31]|uniref:Secreted protein n=1 Tax=Melampsora larici-populina (strain 98AG31 / pathotype 3-4-7) TaxID=747676 RepID=F4R8A6_MELLP|nr:uncharacterized protein MELLADRAFT_124302 [Melampsora larici-populina 98AG31]EGG11644.1 secreted protein [Melampsora larici-populina 98AG31]